MIYTDMTRKAVKIAFKAHAGQLDKSGLPYILHPIHLAEQMETEDTCVVALLHDVVEDTDMTLEELAAEGFTDVQLEALRLLTHGSDISYMDYVRRLKHNPVARAVKLADLRHNSDLTRLTEVRESDMDRVRKYERAMKLLLDETGDN